MAKKKDKQFQSQIVSASNIGWLSIIIWIILIAILSSTNLISSFAGSLGVENTSLAVQSVLLIPIALISITLSYNIDLNRFRIEQKTTKISKFMRYIFSIVISIGILTISWYLFVVISLSMDY